MKKFKVWVYEMLSDENDNISSKRFMGLVSGISLCLALFINLFTEFPVDPILVQSVAALAFGSLGLSSIDKIWANRPGPNSKESFNPDGEDLSDEYEAVQINS